MAADTIALKLRDMFGVQITGECYAIPAKLKEVLNPIAYDLFYVPVAENPYESADSKRFYASKISQPMALKNIERNLSAGLYPTIGSVFKHLYQIVQNSYTYNYKRPRYIDNCERTQVEDLTNELLAEINAIMHRIIPDTQSYVREQTFDFVLEVLQEFRTSSSTPTTRLTTEKALEYIREIKKALTDMTDVVRDEAVANMRQLLADDSPVLQLALHEEALRDLRDKLKTGYFNAKKLK